MNIKIKGLSISLVVLILNFSVCIAQTTRKTIISREQFSKQFVQKNCVYEITERIDLRGKTIVVPEGSTVSFNGGSIENGTIDLNYAKVDGNGIKCAIKHPAGNSVTTSQCMMSERSSADYNSKMLQMLVDNGITIVIDATTLTFDRAITVKEAIQIEGSTPNRTILRFPKSKGFVWNYPSSSHDNRVYNISIETKDNCFDFYNKGGQRPVNLYFSKFENIWATSQEGNCFYAGTNQGYNNSYGSMVFNTVFDDVMVNAPKGCGFVGINGNTIEFRSIKSGSCGESVFLNCGGLFTAFNGTFGSTNTFYKADITRNDNQPMRLVASFKACNVEDFKGVLFDCSGQSGIYCHMSFEDCSFYVSPGESGKIDYCPFQFFYLYNLQWRNCDITYINKAVFDDKHSLFEIVKSSETTFWSDRDIEVVSGNYKQTILASAHNTNFSVTASDYNKYLFQHTERERIDQLFTSQITTVPVEVSVKNGTFPIDKGMFLNVKADKDVTGGKTVVNYPTISSVTTDLVSTCTIKNTSKYSTLVLKHNQKYNSRFWSETGNDVVLAPGQTTFVTIYRYSNATGQRSEMMNVCHVEQPLKLHLKKGNSANRPQLTQSDASFQYYDTSLGKPIWWNGKYWITSEGVRVK